MNTKSSHRNKVINTNADTSIVYSSNASHISTLDSIETIDLDCIGLDTCINNIFYFNDSKSTIVSFPNVDSAWKLNDRAYFITKDSSIYISLGFNYGGKSYEYKEATIGYIEGNLHKFIPEEILNSSFNPYKNTTYTKFFFTVSSFEDFKTNKGIKLGMSLDSVLHKVNNIKLVNDTNSRKIYLYRNEYCLYEAKYIFENNKLIKFSFGYYTP